MIKEVTKWEVDGKIYHSLADAEIADRQSELAMKAIDLLGGEVNDSDFVSGRGVVVISPSSYKRATKLYEDILQERYGKRDAHPRYLDDDTTVPPKVRALGYILHCTFEIGNGDYWRVGQPYFAINPEKLYSEKAIRIV